MIFGSASRRFRRQRLTAITAAYAFAADD